MQVINKQSSCMSRKYSLIMSAQMYKGGPSIYQSDNILISMSTVSERLLKTVSTLGVKY